MSSNNSGDESTSEQNVQQNPIIPVPEKRQKRARIASIIICAITAVLIIAFCVVNGSVDEYYPDATRKNTTSVWYRKKEKLTFPGLFTTALSLFGVVLGTLVDRMSLIVEERHHIQQRYDGSHKKMIKACFSGISWGPVMTLLGLAAVILLILKFVTGKPWFELSYLVYIFSGIGVGPLIMQLLSLNTQSEVHISTILEEKEANVANGLAWSYYFNYLEEALLKFDERVPRNGRNVVELEQGRVQLNSNKLILLVTQDCKTTDDLAELDNNIRKLGTFTNGKYRFPVYELTYNGCKYRYVIQYVRQPLETLVKMSQYGHIKALENESAQLQREYQVKLLYKTLSEILKDPLNTKCQDKCILVGIQAKPTKILNDGTLMNVIMQRVEADESTLEHEVEDGIIHVGPHKKTKQPNTKATTGDDAKLQLVINMEKNDTLCIPYKRTASKVSTEEVGDASGASTSGIEMANLRQPRNSLNNAHENQANTADQL